MAERTQERVERAQRRRDPEGGSPQVANPKTIEKGKQLKEAADRVIKGVDDLLAQEAERLGHGTGEAASIAAAEEIVHSYVQLGGE